MLYCRDTRRKRGKWVGRFLSHFVASSIVDFMWVHFIKSIPSSVQQMSTVQQGFEATRFQTLQSVQFLLLVPVALKQGD